MLGTLYAGGLTGLNAAQHIGQIQPHVAHGLQILLVLQHFAALGAEGHVPVAGGDKGHMAVSDVLVDAIQRGGSTGPACHGDGGSGLHSQRLAIVDAGIEQPVHKGAEVAGRSCKMDRGAENKAIGLRGLILKLGDDVVHSAAAFGAAAAAHDAAVDGFVADPENLGF